jgi:hypothetical protein
MEIGITIFNKVTYSSYVLYVDVEEHKDDNAEVFMKNLVRSAKIAVDEMATDENWEMEDIIISITELEWQYDEAIVKLIDTIYQVEEIPHGENNNTDIEDIKDSPLVFIGDDYTSVKREIDEDIDKCYKAVAKGENIILPKTVMVKIYAKDGDAIAYYNKDTYNL